MKQKLQSPITSKLYTCKVVRNNETVSIERVILSYTTFSTFCIENTHPKQLVKQLKIIAKYHNLDIEKFDEFTFAVDCLKSSISWN